MATVRAMFTITDTGDLSGRNFLQRSFFTKYPWTGPTYNAVGEGFGTYHERKCLPVTARDLYKNTNNGVDTIFPDLTFEEGVQYTISGNWAQFRTDDQFNKMYLFIHYTDGTKVQITQPQQNNIWSSFTHTSTPGKTIDKITASYSIVGITYIENFKLEVGASATDWTPAPEDVNDAYLDAKTANETADYAKTEIDGLEIGGRNLILKGDEEHTRTLTTEGGNNTVPAYSFSLYGRPLAHTEGQIMTVSFDYETSGNSLDTGRIYLQHNNSAIATKQNRIIYLNTTPSGRYVRTYTITSAQAASALNGNVRVYIAECSAGTVVNVKNMKVELGNRATDWTPAPEDVEEAIESKNSVYYQATAPTAHKVGDTWFDTANDYKISRWDGSRWVAAELGDQAVGNLDASHINTGTLAAVHIEVGKSEDTAGTIKVYDEDDAVQVSLDKDGLTATKGNVGGWNIGEKTLESDHVTGVDESGVEHTGKSSLDVEGGLEIVGSSTTAFAPDIYQRGWRPSTASLWGESYIGPRSISSEYLVAKDKAVSNGGFWIPGRNISAWYTLTPRKQIANTGIYFTLYTKGDLSLFWLILDGKTPEWTAGVKNNVATSLVDYVDSSTAHFINSVQRSQVAPPYTIWLVNGRGVGSTSGRGGVCNNYGQEIQPYISMDGYINIYSAATNTSVAAITANVFWAHIDYPYTES